MTDHRSRWLIAAVLAGIIMAPGLVVVPWVTIGVLGMVIVVAATMVWPRQMLVLAFFFILIGTTKFRNRDPTAALAGAIDYQVVFELAMYGSALIIAFLVMRSAEFEPTRITRWEWILAAFAGLALTSALWSSAPTLTAVRAFQFAILLALVMVSMRVLGTSRTLATLLGAAALYTLVMAAYGVWKPGVSMLEDTTMTPRFSWLSVHPIIVGELAATSALFVMAHCLIPEPKRRYVWTRWLVLAGLIAIVIATRSRGPIVSFAVASVVLGLRGLTRSWFPTVAVPAMLAIAAAVAMFFSPVDILRMGEGSENPIIMLLYRGQTVEQLSTLTGRTELWKGIVPLIQDRYLVGYGYLGARGLILTVAPWAGYAHSAFVESLIDLGLIGSLLIWSAVASALFPGKVDAGIQPRRLRRDRVVVFSVMVFIVLSSITTDSFAGAPAYAALVTLVCVLVAERLRAEPS